MTSRGRCLLSLAEAGSLPALSHLVPPDVKQLLKLKKHQVDPPTQAAGTNPNAQRVLLIRPHNHHTLALSEVEVKKKKKRKEKKKEVISPNFMPVLNSECRQWHAVNTQGKLNPRVRGVRGINKGENGAGWPDPQQHRERQDFISPQAINTSRWKTPSARFPPLGNQLPISTIKCENPGCGDQTETNTFNQCAHVKKPSQWIRRVGPEGRARAPRSCLASPRPRIKQRNPICIFPLSASFSSPQPRSSRWRFSFFHRRGFAGSPQTGGQLYCCNLPSPTECHFSRPHVFPMYGKKVAASAGKVMLSRATSLGAAFDVRHACSWRGGESVALVQEHSNLSGFLTVVPKREKWKMPCWPEVGTFYLLTFYVCTQISVISTPHIGKTCLWLLCSEVFKRF